MVNESDNESASSDESTESEDEAPYWPSQSHNEYISEMDDNVVAEEAKDIWVIVDNVNNYLPALRCVSSKVKLKQDPHHIFTRLRKHATPSQRASMNKVTQNILYLDKALLRPQNEMIEMMKVNEKYLQVLRNSSLNLTLRLEYVSQGKYSNIFL